MEKICAKGIHEQIKGVAEKKGKRRGDQAGKEEQ